MTEERSSRPGGRPPTAVGSALEVVAAGLALAAAVLALAGPAPARPVTARPEERPSRPGGRPPTAVQCALAVVAAGLALAVVVLAMAGSARAGSLTALPEEGPYFQEPSIAVNSALVAQAPGSARVLSSSSVPSPTPLPTPTPTPTPFPWPATESMSMPVDGAWRVICGYRCGRHDDDHISTFALDIERVGGETAGQEVRSPVAGRIIAVEDWSTYRCGGKEIEGAEAGAVVIIDFRSPSGAAQRLRIVHLDPESVPDELRPDGRPVPVDGGAVLGSVATMDHCSHLHISLTHLEERQEAAAPIIEVPVPMVIDGATLEDCDGNNCWYGVLLPPEEP